MRLLYALLFFIGALGCKKQRKSVVTKPFHHTIAGLDIVFPRSLAELRKAYTLNYVGDGWYKDTTQIHYTQWYYDWHTYMSDMYKDSTFQTYIVPNAPMYGVSITLKNKADAIDSVRGVLEKQFKRPMPLMEVKHINLAKEFLYQSRTPVYVFSPSPGVYISLRACSCWKGDYPYACGQIHSTDPPAPDNPENNLRLAISFGLQPDEEERFALGSGPIWERVD